MTEKHYSDDIAKAKSRDLVKDMIAKTLLTYKKPTDLRVLCFPGIDAEEILQVYDAISIPRENITGIEKFPDIADKIEEKKLGINLVRGDLLDYLNQQITIPYNVISLDYTNPFGKEHFQTLNALIPKLTAKQLVFHIANLVKRDRQSRAAYFIGYAVAAGDGKVHDPNVMQDTLTRMNEVAKKINNNEPLSEQKSVALTSLVSRHFNNTQSSEDLTHLLKFVSGGKYDIWINFIESNLNKQLGTNVKIDRECPWTTKGVGIASPMFILALEQMIAKCIKGVLEYHGLKGDCYHEGVMSALFYTVTGNRFFTTHNTARYSYISESAAPMMGDIYFLKYPEKAHLAAQELARQVGFPTWFEIKDFKKLDSAGKAYYLAKIADEKARQTLDDRFFLGNSSKPVLTKAKAIQEFQSGLSVDDIKKKYRGWDGKPLPQWKAHVTMGTYSEIPEDNGDIEKITREDAIDLISSGIPAEEIFQTYPTSFTVGQLRAIKAGITKGTYEKEEKE